MKELSAGIIFLNKEKTRIFMGRATFSSPEKWDIPKGHVEPGEIPLDASLRECLEETGHFVEDIENLEDLGLFKYSSNKDLYLFRYRGQDVPDVSKSVCTALHTSKTGETFPEFDKFEWIALNEISSRTGPSLGSVLQQVLQNEIFSYYANYLSVHEGF